MAFRYFEVLVRNMDLEPTFQVSEFIELVNQHLFLLGQIRVEGELSRLDVKNRQLIFATLKDSSSAIDVFSLTYQIRNLAELEPNMKVIVYGSPGLYKGSGRFRLHATEIIPSGAGALQIAFERLKAELESEGLFDPSHKRDLPEWPQRIGLITATGSSAYHDVVKILSTRMGGLIIRHLPVNVQGRNAIPSLLAALAYVNRSARDFDLIILCRGGGSLEDLAAFNSEEVARAVFSLKVPIISAVGHEDDWSLTDYVADVRASTPSNAAELAVKDRHEVSLNIDHQFSHIKSNLNHQIRNKAHHIDHSHHVIKRYTGQLLQRIELISQNLEKLRQLNLERSGRLSHDIDHHLLSIRSSLSGQIKLNRQKLDHYSHLLYSLDYKNVLKRGFSITKMNGKILKDAADVSQGRTLTTILSSGELKSIVRD